MSQTPSNGNGVAPASWGCCEDWMDKVGQGFKRKGLANANWSCFLYFYCFQLVPHPGTLTFVSLASSSVEQGLRCLLTRVPGRVRNSVQYSCLLLKRAQQPSRSGRVASVPLSQTPAHLALTQALGGREKASLTEEDTEAQRGWDRLCLQVVTGASPGPLLEGKAEGRRHLLF